MTGLVYPAETEEEVGNEQMIMSRVSRNWVNYQSGTVQDILKDAMWPGILLTT